MTSTLTGSSAKPRAGFDGEQSLTIPTQRLAPTQRLSEVSRNWPRVFRIHGD